MVLSNDSQSCTAKPTRKPSVRRALLLSLLLVGISSRPSHGEELPGRWISPANAESCPTNVYTYLRKTVVVNSLAGDLSMQLAADSNAHVWINGHVVRRKVTRFFERSIATETIDARRWLHPGSNTVVVLLHSWGPIITFQRFGCTHQGLFVSSSWISSDPSWKVHPADEFEKNTEQIKGIFGHDPRIRFAQFVNGDKLPPPGMFTAGFDDSRWGNAVAVEGGPWPQHPMPSGMPGQRESAVRPLTLLAAGRSLEDHIDGVHPIAIEKGMLHATMESRDEHAVAMPSHLQISAEAGETKYITVDFGRPVHGYPTLTGTVEGAAPIVDFAYQEMGRSPSTGELLVKPDGWLNPESIVGEGYIDRYRAASGTRRVELPDERTARFWTLHLYFPAAGRFRISDLGFVSSQYPTDIKGSFHASDPRIAQIVRLSLRHAIISMSDAYVDTPGREDGQWLEDARLRAQLSSQWFGDTKLRQLFLKLVAESQSPLGVFHPFPPSNYPITSNADWAAEWVGALYDDYMWTGETERIQRYWPQLVAYWNHTFESLQPDGLWVQSAVFADIRVGQHPRKDQSSGIVSAQLIDRLALSVTMARALGRSESDPWQATHDRMLTAFREHHLVASSKGVPLHVDDVFDPGRVSAPRGYSQAAQAMAVSAGLLSARDARADMDYAFTQPEGSPSAGVDRWNNPTYLYRALTSLSAVGLSDLGTQHLFERFSPYLPNNPRNLTPLILQGKDGGPLPEYWISHDDLQLPQGEAASTQPPDPTGSHGWASVGLVWLHEQLLGVTIASPGGADLVIHPNAGGMAHIDGTTLTPHGPVFVAWTPRLLSLQLRLPPHVRVKVTLPPELAAAENRRTLHVPSACKVDVNDVYLCEGSSTLTFTGRN